MNQVTYSIKINDEGEHLLKVSVKELLSQDLTIENVLSLRKALNGKELFEIDGMKAGFTDKAPDKDAPFGVVIGTVKKSVGYMTKGEVTLLDKYCDIFITHVVTIAFKEDLKKAVTAE